jgi:protein translocase SecG subunit
MKTALMAFQVLLSVLLIIAVLGQQKGSGLSATFGGGGGSFKATKRGAEKFLYTATLILSVLFLINSIAFLFL